ncbi:MAG TPA: cob(I)yrinic acid a,c-diamide adenosyltransferase [Bacteroidales bacterium]|nr:cob(I)yrinic acid a,c-diamide adenosyltransferase [Bacteroidales bacterium]
MAKKTKIYSKKGDLGETSLLGGTRVPKSHDRVEAYGTIDELNSYLGLLRDMPIAEHYREVLLRIQNALFIAEAWIAKDPQKKVTGLPAFPLEEITLLEKEIDEMVAEMPPLNSFILPGGHPFVSQCHIARTVCRRAERTVIRMDRKESSDTIIISYLNRLSDFLFVLARKIGFDENAKEITWPVKD